jgi:hypothetical protein
MEACHEIFGLPESRLENSLWWLDGRGFAKYIEAVASGRIELTFDDPYMMAPNEVIGMNNALEAAKIFLQDPWLTDEEQAFIRRRLRVNQQQMSGIARTIYHDYVSNGLQFMDQFPDRYKEERRFHFAGFTQTFIQAFDAVLFTWVHWANNRGEWENMKGDMKKCCLMLARMPTTLQEVYTSSHSTIKYQFWKESPYMIPHLEMIWEMQIAHSEEAFRSVIEKILERGWAFDQCPALIDGTLAKSFDALFVLYGNVFFDKDGEKKVF